MTCYIEFLVGGHISCIFLFDKILDLLQVFELREQNSSTSDSKKHTYILQPISGKAKYTKIQLSEAKKTGQALQNASVDLDDVTLSLSKVCIVIFPLIILFKGPSSIKSSTFYQDGYRDILKMADNFSSFNQRLRYAHLRPSLPVKSDPHAWWKYAYKVVTQEMNKARYAILLHSSLTSTVYEFFTLNPVLICSGFIILLHKSG
jgi:hypothetical protein